MVLLIHVLSEQALSLPRSAATGVSRRVAAGSLIWALLLGNAAVIVWLWIHGGNLATRSSGDALTSIARITGPDLATADAYATAAFAMGSERAPHWTARLRGYQALTILADGRVLSTPGFPGVS